jgi:hypothetical protein
MVQQKYLKRNRCLLSDQNILWVMLTGALEAVNKETKKEMF